MNKLNDILCNVILPLFLGGLIYYFTRQHSIFFLSYFDRLLNLHHTYHLELPPWTTYNLPDGLWTFSFSSILLIIWKRHINLQNLLWLLTPLTIAVFLEFTFGTFDKIDLFYILVGGLLPFFIHSQNKFSFKQKVQHDY